MAWSTSVTLSSSSLLHPQPLNPRLLTLSGGAQRKQMSGVTAQSDVAGAGKVSVGVLWHFCGFHRNLLTWDRAITISRTGSSLSLSGSLHRQLIPTDSNPELWAVCGPSPLHYLCWVHQPSKGTSGAKSLLRWPQVQSPHVTHSRSMRKCMHLDPFC